MKISLGHKIDGTISKVTHMRWWDKFGKNYRWLKCLYDTFFHHKTNV